MLRARATLYVMYGMHSLAELPAHGDVLHVATGRIDRGRLGAAAGSGQS
jgi:hypothetical protein